MSISVKNISVSIDGNASKQFKIEISGVKYTMTGFSLRQQMLDHSHLSFELVKDPLEDISETQFKVCSDIIGKQVTLNLQTDPMEIELKGFSGDTVKDIEFDGFIINASASRRTTQYSISVEAVSWDGLLDNDRDCRAYEEKMLKDIAEDVLSKAAPLDFQVDPAFADEPYLYCVKWNETSYGFLQRLAIRHGEWLFNNGKKLFFGKLPEAETVQLSYPSRDIASYGIDLQARHLNFNQVFSTAKEDKNYTEKEQDKMSDKLNDLNEAAFNMSKDKFKDPTLENLVAGGFAFDIDGSGDMLDKLDKPQALGRKAGLLRYHGSTFCSKLAIGGKLIVVDNYITDEQSNTKSDVPQDEILITSINHTFNCDETYSNFFSGISAKAKHPPYTDASAVPRAMPVRAWVTDNVDPECLGRVRVTFAWQYENNQFDRDYVYTPWIRVEQLHTGKEKGFYFIPEIGEEVMIDFEGGNAEMPYVRSSLFNGEQHTDKSWASEKMVETNEVKAIRTRNGHTIEIHDKKKGGYIKIYDNKKNNYILTFSTDEKLIKLQSSGNIELDAKNDIIMHAGHDMKIDVDNDMTTNVNSNKSTNVVSAYTVIVDSGSTKSTPASPKCYAQMSNDGMIDVVSENHKHQTRQFSHVISDTKLDEVANDYFFVNKLGGISMAGADNCFCIYGNSNLSVTTEDTVGLSGATYIINATKEGFIASDGSLDVAAQDLHMN